MNALKLVSIAALACGLFVASSAPVMVLAQDGSVSQEELAVLLEELKAHMEKDPEFAELLGDLDIDKVLEMDPAEAEKVLNEKLFPEANSTTVESTDGSEDNGSDVIDSDVDNSTDGSAPLPGSSGSEGVDEPSSDVPAPEPSSAVRSAAPIVSAAAMAVVSYVVTL